MLNRRELIGAGLAVPFGGRGASPDLASLDLTEASRLLARREVSPVELTRACLERIEALNPSLNAFITVTADRALERARTAERELLRGKPLGPLHGIPIALKDNIDTAGTRTTAAAAAFEDRVPPVDAEVTQRLRASGAILLGKLNMDECAYGVTSTTGHFGAVHNPWSASRVAGGSSGGPAAAVAARLCYGALGTDTGGSIRQPAAYCGITGLKPTYGLVSTRGVIPLSWSLDHVGPMCRSAADAAALLGAIAGYDAADPASIEAPATDYPKALTASVKGLRLARPRAGFFESLDPEVATAVEAAIAVLGRLTAGVGEIDLPPVPALNVMFVEANAALGDAVKASPEGFSPAVRGLVEMGGRVSAASYAEARRQLALARHAARALFTGVDAIVSPTTPGLPEDVAPSAAEPPRRGPPLSARNTTAFNILGVPTISVCCGFSRDALPIGLQISAAPFAESTLLALAHAYQRETDWHRRAPS